MLLRTSVGAARSPGQNADWSQPSSSGVFDEFGITAKLEKALRPKVLLKSVWYIVVNEELVAIDTNTGQCVGRSSVTVRRIQGDQLRTAADPLAGPSPSG